MPNAFYRSTSSSAKKNSDRERRQPDAPFPEDADLAVGVQESEAAPKRKGRAANDKAPEDRASDAERAEKGGLTWNAQITPSALVTMSVLGLILLGFTFLAGVIVGRGTMPLPRALELESLAEERRSAKDAEADRILSQEELRFMTSLKREDAAGVLSAAKPANREKAAKARKPEKKAEKKEAKAQTFDYVLRVAAFKDVEPAKRLMARLIKDGMKATRSQAKTNSGLWNYVSVSMRGTVADLQVMRRRLDKFGLHDAIVIARRPVEDAGQGKGAKQR